jgi:hypothetical protein
MDARVKPAQDQEEYGSINRSGGDPIDFERMSNSMHFEERASAKMPLLSTVSAHTEDERRMT